MKAFPLPPRDNDGRSAATVRFAPPGAILVTRPVSPWVEGG
jgi:hypothetical protein